MEYPSPLEYLILVFLSIICGLAIRIALGYAKQTWATTYHHTMSYALLPAITMIITTLISGNIALSLGMVGALSIVRFRNPVKNPFELVIFFALITIGIGISVNVKLGILMTVVTILVILVSISFEEGSNVNVMEVKSLNPIQVLEDHKYLVQTYLTKNPATHNYRLISSYKNEIKNLKKSIEADKGIESIEVRYGT